MKSAAAAAIRRVGGVMNHRTVAQQHHRRDLWASTTTTGSVRTMPRRMLATATPQNNNNESEEPKQQESTESLKETVERLRHQSGSDPSNSTSSKEQENTQSTASTMNSDNLFRTAVQQWDTFAAEVSTVWRDLIQSSQRQSINKKIVQQHPSETASGNAPYTGPAALLIVEPDLTAWERMQKRLAEAPLIQDILERSQQVYEQSGAAAAKQRVDHLREDAREAWETSQNPWVYRISSVYDTMTAESPETRAVAELRVLDPSFTLEDWRQDVVEHTLPIIMAWFLEGRINQLKPWLGEAVFKRLAAEMTAREREGVQIDTHVLAIMNSEIIAIEVSCYFRASVSLFDGCFSDAAWRCFLFFETVDLFAFSPDCLFWFRCLIKK